MSETTQPTVLDLLARHGPAHWDEAHDPQELCRVIEAGEPLGCVVLAADIRSSTILMREAVNPRAFASCLTRFVTAVQVTLKNSRGWFDKFTGDGFLAYWILRPNQDPRDYVREISENCNSYLHVFRHLVAEELRHVCRNIPQRMGLSIGLDGGLATPVLVAGDLTLVGGPVVGAVRMVTAAEPYETLLNSVLGAPLYTDRDTLESQLGLRVERTIRPTKEYPAGQEVYPVTFLRPPASRDGV